MGLLGLEQPLDDLATDEVLVDDLGDVVDGDVAVPDLLRVDDNAYAVFALVEAPGVVGAHDLRDATSRELGLEPVSHLDTALCLAGTLRVVCRALVGAHEHMTLKARHLPKEYHGCLPLLSLPVRRILPTVIGTGRLLAVALAFGSAMLAYAAVGNGDLRATPPTTVVTVTSPAGSASASTTLENTTASTTYSVLVSSDATCDPAMSFAVSGGTPSTIAASSSRSVQITCPPRGTAAMRRCLYHGTNNLTDAPLVDFMGVCLYGSAPGTLTPLATSIDFGGVDVGNFVQRTLTIRNDGTQTLTRVYLQTSDPDGDFQLAAPCNPDASYCDEELISAIAPGQSFNVTIKCRPQSSGTHTAELHVGTNTFQLLSTSVALTCAGTPTPLPALVVDPTTITIPSPVEVDGDTAQVVTHLANAGGGTLVITDVRLVDVDNTASNDWRYTTSGTCSGQITSTCSLGSGDRVDMNLTFDPSVIGRRRASLLISYRDTLDRTVEIPLEGTGAGATVRTLSAAASLDFGTVPVGRASQLTVELGNDGNRTANVSLGLAPMAPFSVSPTTSATVLPAMTRTLSVACSPATAGDFATTLTITPTDTVSTTPITLSATCQGTTSDLYANPTSLMLGELRIGAGPYVRSVQLLSDGGAPLTIVGQPALESPDPAYSLGPLSQQSTPATFDVTINPQSTGQLAATVVVATSSGDTLRIPITAAVVEASYIVSSTLDLGTFCVDQPTTPSNVALVSDGDATIELLAPILQLMPSPFELALTNPVAYPFALPGAAAAVASVTPKRQQSATIVNDTLTWRTDVAGKATANTGLTARFISSGGAIAPPALTFGEVTVHLFTDNGQRIVIQNCNPTPLVLDPPMIRTPFSIDSPNFPSMLNPNESVAFSVGFHPTRVGPVTDTLRITSPQLPGAPLEVMLVGVGGSGDAQAPDAGVGSNNFEQTSFYACACRTSRPAGGWPLVLALATIIARRRRAASSPR